MNFPEPHHCLDQQGVPVLLTAVTGEGVDPSLCSFPLVVKSWAGLLWV